MKNKEKILKEFDERFILKKHNNYVDEDSIGEVATGYGYTNEDIKQFISDIINQTRKETIREEIAYWIDVFDNRPKNRDLESDNIAQNFARIEIERLENKLKK